MGNLYLYLTAYCVAGQVLFRYAVAILKYMETALMSTSSCGDLNNVMRYIGDSLHDADHLAQVTFYHLCRQSHLFVGLCLCQHYFSNDCGRVSLGTTQMSSFKFKFNMKFVGHCFTHCTGVTDKLNQKVHS